MLVRATEQGSSGYTALSIRGAAGTPGYLFAEAARPDIEMWLSATGSSRSTPTREEANYSLTPASAARRSVRECDAQAE